MCPAQTPGYPGYVIGLRPISTDIHFISPVQMEPPVLVSDCQAQFRECLSCPGYHLGCFQTPHPRSFFPLAEVEPQFFQYNLVSPCRTVRELPNSCEGAIRVFYYQLLKICFELELYQSRGVLQHFKSRVFSPGFRIGLGRALIDSGYDREEILTEAQSKKVLAEFLQALGAGEIAVNCETMVNRYPLLDAIFIQVFKSMLTNPTSMESIFGELADEFGLCVTLIGDCFKFEDSDIFCYVPADSEWMYLTFMDSSFIQQQPELPQPLDPIEERFGSQSGTKNTATPQVHSNVAIDSMDDVLGTDRNINTGKKEEEDISAVYTPEGSFLRGAFSKKLFQVVESIEIREFRESNHSIPSQTSIIDPGKLDKSFERIKQELDDRMKSTSTRLTSASDIAQFNPYTPSSLQYIPQYTPQYAPQYAPQYPSPGQYDYRGDYYQDFTKTFLLESVEEPFRSNIRSIKNGMRGLRRPVCLKPSYH